MAEASKASGEADKAGFGNENNSSSRQQPSSAGGFDCNICLELAQDPVVTLCGHLFCWPCLFRWLRGHSTCHECPVCKALVEEDKVVPLYGRGNPGSSDPRRKPPPPATADIPHRPPGQRPQTARAASDHHHFNQHQQQPPGFNFMAAPGGAPMAAARFGNFTFSAGFGDFLGGSYNIYRVWPMASIYGKPIVDIQPPGLYGKLPKEMPTITEKCPASTGKPLGRCPAGDKCSSIEHRV